LLVIWLKLKPIYDKININQLTL